MKIVPVVLTLLWFGLGVAAWVDSGLWPTAVPCILLAFAIFDRARKDQRIAALELEIAQEPQRTAERMEAAGTMLLRKGGLEFEKDGPESRFGAGIWAAGCYLREKYDESEQVEAARWMAERRLEDSHGDGA